MASMRGEVRAIDIGSGLKKVEPHPFGFTRFAMIDALIAAEVSVNAVNVDGSSALSTALQLRRDQTESRPSATSHA